MKSHSLVVARHRDGQTILSDLRSEPPISLRPTRRGVAVVGSAAGPVGGDDAALVIEVGAHASLCMEPIAATMLFPGRCGEGSRQNIRIQVGESGHLQWCGQPMLSVIGSRHVQRVQIDLAATATLDYLDWIVMGRSSEAGGRLDTELRVVREDSVILHQRQVYDAFEPGWATSAGLGRYDEVKQHLRVGPVARSTKVVSSPLQVEMVTPVLDDVELKVTLSRRPPPGTPASALDVASCEGSGEV